MPEWLTILLAVIGGIGTILGFLGLTAYLTERGKHKAKRRNEREDREMAESEQTRHQMYLDELRGIIRSEVAPIAQDIATIKHDQELLKRGSQVTCRMILENIYAEAERDGWCPSETKQRFEDTYQIYHSLGRNGVMDAKRERLLAMPETKPVRQNKVKKTPLVES